MEISQNSTEKHLRDVESTKCYKNLSNSENKIIFKKLVSLNMETDDFRYLNAALKIYDYLEAKNDVEGLVEIKRDALTYVKKKVLGQ